MKKAASSLLTALVATLVLAHPLSALADKKGGDSGRGHGGSHGQSRGASGPSGASGTSGSAGAGGAAQGAGPSRGESRGERHGESHAREGREGGEHHNRAEGREHAEHRDRDGMGPMARTRTPMGPEAASLAQQARAAEREYRTTGSAQAQATMQSLRASLAAMGYSRAPHQAGATPPSAPVASTPGTRPATPGTTTPGTNTPVAGAPAAPAPAPGTNVAGVSGVAAN
jgi:hypothetical protein